MFLVDTNLLVYAAVEESSDHGEARRLLVQWRNQPRSWFATWPIIYEFLRVVTHRSVFAQPLTVSEAWEFVSALMESPSFFVLSETPRHAQVVTGLLQEYPRIFGSVLHDFHTVALMREHGITEIRTADSHFHQFKFLRVVNPLT
jgi:uncharacterized protein